ncbi:MAG: ABC transporter permease [Chloroflexi bacterium]|nr:ABC transporter permease [Chloroflexota bacterium]
MNKKQIVAILRLAPNAFLPLVVGKILAGLTATAANMTVTLVLAVALFGLRIPPDRWLSLAASGIGLGVGAWFRDYRTIQPLLIVTVAGSIFAAGGYASVPTLPPFVQAFDVY